MPRGNGMGPMGMGPMTGRAAGSCAGNGKPGVAGLGAGLGCGFGRGRGGGGGFGRGFRNRFFASGLPGWMRAIDQAVPGRAGGIDERQALAGQADALQRQLDELKRRLETLDVKGN